MEGPEPGKTDGMKPRTTAILLTAAGAILLAAIGAGWLVFHAGDKPLPAAALPEPVSPWAPLFDHAVPAGERLALARRLDGSFDLPSVKPWIRRRQAEGHGAVPAEDRLVYNELLDQSRQRGLFPDTLGEFLMEDLHDPALDLVLRDYSLQQLALWISAGGSGQPAEADPVRRQAAGTALCGILRDEALRGTTLPGTALLSLADMALKSPADLEPFQKELDATISGILTDWNQPVSLRISAIQSAALMDRRALLPTVRAMLPVLTPDQPEFLSVIAALGRMGGASDRALLEALPSSSPLAARAVASALQRLPEVSSQAPVPSPAQPH